MSFEEIGRVGYINIKYNEDVAKTRTVISLGVKKYKKEEYDNFFITFFNYKELAERVSEYVKKGDYIRVKGSLSVNKYQEKETIQLIGWSYSKVMFDKEQKKYIDIADNYDNSNEDEPAPKKDDELIGESDIPF